MSKRWWGVRVLWRLFGVVLIGWVMLSPLFEYNDPLRAAAMTVPLQGVSFASHSAGVAQSSPPRYLIITPDELAAPLAGYVAAKRGQGYEVIVQTLSQTGSTATQIRAVIGSYSPQFLLLVGDVDLLPAWESRNGLTTPTDLYYATLGGVWDYTPDLAYARLPVHSTAELQAALNNWAAYEALDGSQAWLSRAAFIASGAADDRQTAESTHNQVIEAYTRPGGFGGQFPKDPQPGGDRLYAYSHAAGPADVLAALNAGRGLAVYFGQGGDLGWNSPYLTLSDVQSLNGPPLPLLVSFASRNALLSPNQMSFGEAWLLQPGSGALALIAPGDLTDREESSRLEAELFKTLFASRSPSQPLGEVLQLALQEFSHYYLPNALAVRQAYEKYTLWGDPTLRLWLDAPLRFSIDLEPPTVSVCGGAAQSVPVQITLACGQSPSVTLSLPDPPPGVSGVFSPNPLRCPGVAGLTLHLSADLAAGQYPLTVRGESGGIQQQAALSLNVRPAAPAALPLPVLPANGAVQVSLRPQLSWSGVASADHYEVQIALDVNFEQIVASLEGIPQTVFTLSQDLQPSQTYYWRVRAANGCGKSNFSPPAQFTTVPPPGECPPGSQAEVLYAQAFDTPPDDWVLEGGWQTGSAFGRGGVVKAGAPPEIHSQFLTSPLFALPGEADVLAVELRAELAYDFGEPPACLDGARLEVSTDDGRTWAKLPEEALLTPPYDGQLAVSFGNPLGGERAWCQQRGWSPLVADLSGYRGQSLRLRLVVATGADEQSAPGLALDDLEVTACSQANVPQQLILTPARQAVILPPGRSGTFEWQVFNQTSTSQIISLTASGSLPVVITPEYRSIPPGETAVFQVQVSLPETAVPGTEHSLSLLAKSENAPALWAAAELHLTVQRCDLNLSAPFTIPPLTPGEPYTLFVTLTNSGNAADTFSLSAVAGRGWPISLPDNLLIPAAESAGVELTIQPPQTALPGEQSGLFITARSAACPNVQQTLERPLVIKGSSLFLPLIGR